MKRVLSFLLAVMLLLSTTMALAEGTGNEEAANEEELSVTDIALYYRPVSEEPVHITVGNTTKVSGSFFTTQFGNNTSDIDVRYMLHGYNPIYWESQVEFQPDPQVVESLTTGNDAYGNTVYTVKLMDDLLWNDGETKITAEDYVFAYLLQASDEFTAIGAETASFEHIVGFEQYSTGEVNEFAGIRLINDRTYSVTVKAEYEPYFYELSYLWIYPCPASVIAPGCKVVDSEWGASIVNEDESAEPVFTAELLQSTILDETTGYLSYPRVTCGPYSLAGYEKEEGRVEFEINVYYKGNHEGVKPYIDAVTLVPVLPENMAEKLENGEVDLLNKCVAGDVINELRGLLGEGIASVNYARLGYGFIAFACEKGPQQFMAVRQALAYAFDQDSFVQEYLKGYGLNVYGYYGLGQWMTYAANGTLRPEEMTPEEMEAWDACTLDGLNTYEVNFGMSNQLLNEDGWVFNEEGQPFRLGKDRVRYKEVNGELMPLSFKFASTIGNDGAKLVVDILELAFREIGAELIVEEVPFTELLADYYRTDSEREYDLRFMATNFVSVFDPYITFTKGVGITGTVNTSGLYDEKLVDLAWKMHITEPLDVLTFEQRWIAFQTRFNEILPSIPLYSNVYFDFHSDWLQNYYANAEINWPVALLYSYWAEPVREEEEAEEEEAENGETGSESAVSETAAEEEETEAPEETTEQKTN